MQLADLAVKSPRGSSPAGSHRPLPRADHAHEAEHAEGCDDQRDDGQCGAYNAGDREHDPDDPDRSRNSSRDHQLIGAPFARPPGCVGAALLKLTHIHEGSERRVCG